VSACGAAPDEGPHPSLAATAPADCVRARRRVPRSNPPIVRGIPAPTASFRDSRCRGGPNSGAAPSPHGRNATRRSGSVQRGRNRSSLPSGSQDQVPCCMLPLPENIRRRAAKAPIPVRSFSFFCCIRAGDGWPTRYTPAAADGRGGNPAGGQTAAVAGGIAHPGRSARVGRELISNAVSLQNSSAPETLAAQAVVFFAQGSQTVTFRLPLREANHLMTRRALSLPDTETIGHMSRLERPAGRSPVCLCLSLGLAGQFHHRRKSLRLLAQKAKHRSLSASAFLITPR
jgi:hypothetical protein